jgi:ATP-binding cassette, subfamily B, bacterial PglK
MLKDLFINYKKFTSVLNIKEKRYFYYLVLMMVVASLIEVLSISLIIPLAYFLVENKNQIYEHDFFNYFPFLKNITYENLVLISLMLILLIFLAKLIYMIFLTKKKNVFIFNLRYEFSQKVFRSYINRPYIYFLNHGTSSMISNCINNVNTFAAYGLQGFIDILIEGIIIFGILMFLFIYEPIGSTFVGLIGVLFFLVFDKYLKKKSFHLGEQNRVLDIELVKSARQGLSGVKEIIMYQAQKKFNSFFSKAAFESSKVAGKQRIISELPRFILEFLAVLCFVMFMMFMFSFFYSSSTIIVTLSVFSIATFKLLPSINRLIVSVHATRYGFPAFEQIKAELDYLQNIKINKDQKNWEKINFNESLSLNDINFRYEGSDKLLFENLNLNIKKGEIIGISGISGKGKTTLVNLISGLLKPSKGTIQIDKKIVDDSHSYLQEKIGYIPQEIYLLDDSIEKNIAFFEDENEINQLKINEAIESSQITEFVNQLPLRSKTIIGERGARLSGGQAQRIAIARALYKGSEIMILDEATSSLDVKNEDKILSTIKSFKNKKTIIIISHHLPALSICDKIYKLENSKLELTKQ